MRKIKNLLLAALVSVAAGILALFVSVAIKAYFSPVVPPAPIHFQEFKADSIVGYKYEPYVHYSYVEKGRDAKIIHVYYDRFGARVSSEENESHVPSDILVIGGSQTWGQGVEQEETFSAHLARALHLNSVNLGVSSYGGVSSLLMLKRNLSIFKPKYIVYGFWQDHINRNVIPCVENGLPVCEKRPTISKMNTKKLVILPADNNSDSMRAVKEWYTAGRADFWFSLKWTWKKLVWNLYKILHRSPNLNPLQTDEGKKKATLYVLHEMSKISENANAKLIVIFIPYYFQKRISPMPDYISQASKKDNFILVNMEVAFRKMFQAGDSIAIPYDGHMSPQAHLVIAKQVLKKLRHLHN